MKDTDITPNDARVAGNGHGRNEDDEPRAADGRIPGRRGRETRDRLLEATETLLATTSFRDLKVVDIARQVGSSPATFYQYFPDVEAAILEVAQRMVDDAEVLVGSLDDASWTGKSAVETATALVQAFLDFWREHEAVMRVVDLAVVEGDGAFREIRNAMLAPPSRRLQKAIKQMQAEGRHPASVDPRAQAGVLVSMLAHVAEHRRGHESFGVAEDAAVRSMARIIVWSVTGRRPVE